MPYPYNFCTPGNIDDLNILMAVCADAANLLTLGSQTRPTNPTLYSNLMFPSVGDVSGGRVFPDETGRPEAGIGAHHHLTTIVLNRGDAEPAFRFESVRNSVYRYCLFYKVNEILKTIRLTNHFFTEDHKRGMLFSGFTKLDYSANPVDTNVHPFTRNLRNDIGPSATYEKRQNPNSVSKWTHNCGELAEIAFTFLTLLCNESLRFDEISLCAGVGFDHAFCIINTHGRQLVVDPFFGFFGSISIYNKIIQYSLSQDGFQFARSRIKTFRLYSPPSETQFGLNSYKKNISLTLEDCINIQRNPISGIISERFGYFGSKNYASFVLGYLTQIINFGIQKQSILLDAL